MKVSEHIHEINAHNFLFNFVPKELLYIKNNYSKFEQELAPALGVLCTLDGDM
jgi:hypothetical protein